MSQTPGILPNVAVVIPALNEARAIRAVALDALAYCGKVIIVDDGSSDGTAAAIADLPLECIHHATPQGKAQALRDGFLRALELGCDGVLTMDGDGQHAAVDLPRLLAAATLYPQRIVIGARLRQRANTPGKNRFGNQQADFWVSWVCGQHIVDSQSGQRYYPPAVVELALHSDNRGFVFESQILIDAARLGIATVSVPIEARYADGRRASHFKPLRDVLRITRMIAWRLFRGGMMLGHLRRSRTVPPVIVDSV